MFNMVFTLFGPALARDAAGPLTLALALALRCCHSRRMNRPVPGSGHAGGSLVALFVLAGAVTGVVIRQPMLGLLGGLLIGLAMFALTWLLGRRS